ncbi:uncharacterized protein [Sinocyclocheilus grahami]|uniref:uncharacterized protein n=1 Tax=Sinocyclocheilus grahami TaxID=75366 RepID=UPI0007ACD11A|nr:PREDICTED: uncharacterized protein LOC107576557 [Sinocyclocheilus grahami]
MKIIWTFTLLLIPGTMTSVGLAGNSGHKVNMTCTYDSNDKAKEKYFCKVLWSESTDKTNTEYEWAEVGRFSLNDNKRTAVFTIGDLRKRDSGPCGDNKSGINVCTEVDLTIILGSSLTIGLSVAAVLIIIGLVSFTVIYCMRRPNSASKMPKPGKGNSEAVPQTGFIYEEIADTRPHTDPDTGTKTVYATAQLPTTPSDSTKTVYATPGLPTNPSDSTKTVYATPGLPTTPSDSTKTVYATSQLPTNPSD